MPRRYGYLWEELTSFENLYLAARKARRGKRAKPAVEAFEFNLEGNLVVLREELLAHQYRPGPFREFSISDPKPRLISAAPYRDRVVHHALCNVLEPIFERSFIFDSYACRKGKGSNGATADDQLTQYVYDANDRLKEELDRGQDATIDQVTLYEYGPNASPVYGGDWTMQTRKTVYNGADTTAPRVSQTDYGFNRQGQMATSSVKLYGPDGVTITSQTDSGYTYNDQGIRVSQTIDGQTTNYVVVILRPDKEPEVLR